MEEVIDKISELQFHGIDYLIKINSTSDELFIELEQKYTGDIWRNSFSIQFIEEITQKTGNYKKFNVFIKMLLSSVNQESESVFIDVLTYHDLEMIKSRKIPNRNQPGKQNNTAQNNKRFIILTYMVEYDKVHYPLPLNFEENPDPDTLKQTIRRLKLELEGKSEDLKSSDNGSNAYTLKQENELLRQKIRRFEKSQHNLEDNKRVNNDDEYIREINYLKENLEEKDTDLEQYKKQIHNMRGQILNLQNQIEDQSQIKEQSNLNQKADGKIQEFEIQIREMLIEKREILTLNKRLENRIQALEIELENTVQRRQNVKKQLNTSTTSSNFKRATSMPSPLKRSITPKTGISNLKKSGSKILSGNKKSSTNILNRSIDSDTVASRMKKSSMHSPLRNVSGNKKQALSNNNSQKKLPTFARSPKLSQKSPIQSYKQPSSSFRSKQSGSKASLISTGTVNKSGNKKSSVMKNSQVSQVSGYDSEEDNRLLKKLEILRQKNKENTDSINMVNKSKVGGMSQDFGSVSQISLKQQQVPDENFGLRSSQLSQQQQLMKENISQIQNQSSKSFRGVKPNDVIREKQLSQITYDGNESSIEGGDIDERLNYLGNLLNQARQ